MLKNPVTTPPLPGLLRAETPRRLLIGPGWREAASGATFAAIDPASGETLADIARGDAVDVDHAVAAARAAFTGPWSRVKPAERQQLILRLAELLEAHADELALLDTLEMGAPLATAGAAVRGALGRLRWYAAQALNIHGETVENSLPGAVSTFTLKEPVGVVGAIIPWNSPVASTMWKLGPVLASRCTVVLKPAEEASLSVLRIGELCLEAGVPEGVVNIVTGLGHEAGAALAAHPDVDKVAFTGSVATARRIVEASAGNLKRLSLELGGKSPFIVFADSDLEAAVRGAAIANFHNAGQICSAGSRLFVEAPIYDEFAEAFAQFARGLRVGPGLDPETDVGPVVSRAQFDRVLTLLEAGIGEGARAAAGGAALSDGELSRGYFVAPTVLRDVHGEMTVAREEIFGPVASMLSFQDADEVAARANATPYGLAAGVWTSDIRKANAFTRALRAGTVWVNCYQVMDPAMPFGGFGQSGYGREGGLQHLEEYLDVKAVYIDGG